MTKKIDFFFGVASPWAYIGLDCFADLASRHGAEIKPYVIPLVEENGGIYSRSRPGPRRAYWTTDLNRWATIRNKTLNFENRASLSDPTSAGFLIIAAQQSGLDWLNLTKALMSAFWGEGKDIGNAEIRKQIADAAGFDADALEAKAQSVLVRDAWRDNYEIAKNAGVFGFPTFRYEGQLYWGQDNLPFLDRHLKGQPIAVD